MSSQRSAVSAEAGTFRDTTAPEVGNQDCRSAKRFKGGGGEQGFAESDSSWPAAQRRVVSIDVNGKGAK